jgi:hypothetical protein
MLGIHHHITTAEAALAVSSIVGIGTIYNSIINRAQALWQRARDAERRETRISVAFEHSGFYVDPAPDPVPPQPPADYAFRILVVNSSETSTVWVRRVTVEEAAGDGAMDTDIASCGPVRLEPGEPVIQDVQPATWPLDFAKGIVVKVHLVPDEWQESAVELLLPELMGERADIRPNRIDSPPAPTTPVDGR